MQNMMIEFDEFAVGVYHAVDREKLVGHIPIELSSLMYNFLAANDNNSLRVIVTGKRAREVGFVAPATYSAFTKCEKTAEILEKELERRKQIFRHYNLTFKLSEKVALYPVVLVRVQTKTFIMQLFVYFLCFSH